jgi:hypothetical protein
MTDTTSDHSAAAGVVLEEPSLARAQERRAQKHAVERAIPWHGLHLEAQERFGIEYFRPGRRQVLEAIFHGRNVQQEEVVEVRTAVGEIVTTAPETLPKPDTARSTAKATSFVIASSARVGCWM